MPNLRQKTHSKCINLTRYGLVAWLLPFWALMTHLLLPLNPLQSQLSPPHVRNFHKPIAETSAQNEPRQENSR